MSHDRYLEHLRRVQLFSSCSTRELQRIARMVDEIDVDAGRVLTTEGMIAHEAFIIVSGAASVSIQGTDVATLGPGQQFGELALLDGGPRTATVVATSPMTLLVMTHQAFMSLLDDVPGLARRVLASMAARLREADAHVFG